jgi:hypothetical protein
VRVQVPPFPIHNKNFYRAILILFFLAKIDKRQFG